jgi:hypothetical protein
VICGQPALPDQISLERKIDIPIILNEMEPLLKILFRGKDIKGGKNQAV